jgi:arylsulfatase A-like enzyme
MMDVKAPDSMDGADMSPLFDGKRLRKREYAIGGYGNSFFIRTRRWALWARTRPGRFHLYDKRRDPGENHNVAHRHPGVVRDLYGIVRKRFGRLPYYGATERSG